MLGIKGHREAAACLTIHKRQSKVTIMKGSKVDYSRLWQSHIEAHPFVVESKWWSKKDDSSTKVCGCSATPGPVPIAGRDTSQKSIRPTFGVLPVRPGSTCESCPYSPRNAVAEFSAHHTTEWARVALREIGNGQGLSIDIPVTHGVLRRGGGEPPPLRFWKVQWLLLDAQGGRNNMSEGNFASTSTLAFKLTTNIFLFFSNFISVLDLISIAPKPTTPPSPSLPSVPNRLQPHLNYAHPSQALLNLFTIELHLFVAFENLPGSFRADYYLLQAATMQSEGNSAADLPVAPSMDRSGRAAERHGLPDIQRNEYLIQHYIAELESYVKAQQMVSGETSLIIQALATVITNLHNIKRKAVITAKDVEHVIAAVKDAMSAANIRSKATGVKEAEAKAKIRAETEDEGRRCKSASTNIPAAAAFLHIVDTLDIAYYELGKALQASQLRSYRALERENARLQFNLAAQEDTIAGLEQEIAELKQSKDSSSEGTLINLLD
ncbi:hypothetical protein CNYM01_07561 [Colletotrichum nymphaeae SA-01]|uniref:Uncharacterized protein n=1 Tax=Colletotrichum nymphaeae SA-01 TaxID=1460502 RepID=A0A135SE70_9PEZI|nr:hypothetical protein CNYM01_07561 [Colletotrichum nymphaeae SA-01]